jgi:lipopolysaccharide export system permease protein
MKNGDFVNVYIKKDTGKNSYQITFAKTGKLKIGLNDILELYNGETINNVNNKISKFQFQKSDFSLNNLESNILEFNKLQETPSLVLWSCLDQIFKTDIEFLKRIDVTNYNHNCNRNGLANIFKELYKRYIIPFYIPVLVLITLILIQKSKEEKNYNNFKITVFLINFFIIILSETSLKFINNSIIDNTILAIVPLLLICILVLNFFYQFKWK